MSTEYISGLALVGVGVAVAVFAALLPRVLKNTGEEDGCGGCFMWIIAAILIIGGLGLLGIDWR